MMTRSPSNYRITRALVQCIVGKSSRAMVVEECQGTEKWLGRWLTRGEVALRNTREECWVVVRGVVRDLTELCRKYEGQEALKPLMAEAGKDISHWFNTRGELQTFVHPISRNEMPYLPHGPVPQVSDEYRASPCWTRTPLVPWWKDRRLFVGRITSKDRPLRIRNMLTDFEAKFTVCEEDTVGGMIAERYRPYNSALESYVWRYKDQELDMEKTLTENGVEDLRDRVRFLDLPECLYVPCIMLYYKDDFL